MEHLARRAITTIRENYHEPLALDDLARSVVMSKFYFIRVFQRTTGVTPGRFLSAVRIQEAKCLLAHTHSNVADISARVGYSSPSTFSRRFTASVGVSPTQYRKISRGECAEVLQITPSPVTTGPVGSISGMAHVTGTTLSPVYVGIFDSPILQGQPSAWTRLDGTGAFSLPDVPQGSTWYLHAVTLGARAAGDQCCGSPLLVGVVGPVEIGAGTHICLDLSVRQEDWRRPPVLLALPGLGQRPSPPAAGDVPHPAGLAGPEARSRTPHRRTGSGGRLVGV